MLDLRPLNVYCRSYGMKMNTLRNLAAMGLQKDALMFSWDLEDGFHSLGIEPSYRKYMTFLLAGKHGQQELIRCAAVPFGWTTSPWVFQKVMEVVVRLLHTPGLPTAEAVVSKPAFAAAALPQGSEIVRVGGRRTRLVLVDYRPP